MISDNANNGLEGKKVILTRTSPSTPKVKKTAKTDANGCYHFSNLRNGTYKVRVMSCTGGGVQTKKVKGGSKENDVNFTCQ